MSWMIYLETFKIMLEERMIKKKFKLKREILFLFQPAMEMISELF